MGGSGDDIGALEHNCQWDDLDPSADGVAVNASRVIRIGAIAAAAIIFVCTMNEIASTTHPSAAGLDYGYG
jgi:hypothetical protein